MAVRQNKVSIHIDEYLENTIQMYGIPKILWLMADWNAPAYISHNICVTRDCVKESFEVIEILEDEVNTMIHYERKLEEGILKESLALQHIFSVSDIQLYRETPTNASFMSDSEFFNINLIDMCGKEEEIAKMKKTEINT